MNKHDAERRNWSGPSSSSAGAPGRAVCSSIWARSIFSSTEEQLSEFNIATEVFGRSEKNFDPTADAVVRVEAHRLRKKLRDIYEKDDRAQGIADFPARRAPTSPSSRRSRPDRGRAGSGKSTDRAASPGGLALVLVAHPSIAIARRRLLFDRSPACHSRRHNHSRQRTSGSPARNERHSSPRFTSCPATTAAKSSTVPACAGRQIGISRAAGNGRRDSGFVRGTSRPFLFTNWRTGEFGYDIPMARGSYEMRLFFVSPVQVG